MGYRQGKVLGCGYGFVCLAEQDREEGDLSQRGLGGMVSCTTQACVPQIPCHNFPTALRGQGTTSSVKSPAAPFSSSWENTNFQCKEKEKISTLLSTCFLWSVDVKWSEEHLHDNDKLPVSSFRTPGCKEQE